jgi:hypothetical protein
MLVDFEAAIAAFADAIARKRRASPASTPQDVAAASRFLLNVHRSMPAYLRVPFRALTLVFDGWAYVANGKPFHRLDPARRIAQIDAWLRSRLETRRRFVEFCTALAVFGLYSELYGRDYEAGAMPRREVGDGA